LTEEDSGYIGFTGTQQHKHDDNKHLAKDNVRLSLIKMVIGEKPYDKCRQKRYPRYIKSQAKAPAFII
jgi:hypothetical protein